MLVYIFCIQAIKMSLSEFFGFGGYSREAEGYMSPEHLISVTVLVAIMILCAIIFGLKYKNKEIKQKNKVLIVSAFLIDAFEIFKIVILSVRHEDAFYFVRVLPLFLCSIQLITIPLAAFSKGRIKEASLDFVTVFGVLGAILGTYCAGNNYSAYPVFSFDNLISGITHCISGFAALYIIISGMVSMQKRNIVITSGILGAFCVAAYIANIFVDCNYMFLSRGDGTPYDIVFNLVKGNQILYPLCVVLLFVIYIIAFYYIFYALTKKPKAKETKEAQPKKTEREYSNV
ncbi:MAG: hypothetical protein E7480_02975 [Ruminococcaceae bacterium]|nr:hypothetical protein [Oscillospiraceae bacterium]